MLFSGCAGPRVINAFIVFVLSLGALFAGLAANAQTTTNAENPCACWIDAKTGESVPTVPLSGINLGGVTAGGAGATQMDGADPHADHASNLKTGQTFYRRPDGCWIDVKTGKPVPTVPLSGINLGGVTAAGAGATQMDASDPNADHASNPKTGQTFVRVPCPPPTATTTHPPAPSAPPQENKTPPAPHKPVSMSGFTPAIQLRGFGGASIVNGNAPATAGFDVAARWPLGARIFVCVPAVGFQWADSSIVKTIGGGPPPSTFINTSVGFKTGNFGGRIGFPFGGWEIGVRGGATVASSAITQATGFCGTGTPTGGPAGCHVTSSTTTHDTVTGPFVGGYISHSIFSHVGVFAEFDYTRLKDSNVYDVSNRVVVVGIVLSFGRHQAK